MTTKEESTKIVNNLWKKHRGGWGVLQKFNKSLHKRYLLNFITNCYILHVVSRKSSKQSDMLRNKSCNCVCKHYCKMLIQYCSVHDSLTCFDWLIDFISFYVPFENISFIWRLPIALVYISYIHAYMYEFKKGKIYLLLSIKSYILL